MRKTRLQIIALLVFASALFDVTQNTAESIGSLADAPELAVTSTKMGAAGYP